jgi:hypothetical protein
MWDNSSRLSEQARSHAMCSALRGAIMHKMKFNDRDFIYLANKTGIRRWLGDSGIDPFYSFACGSERGGENISAAKAIEKWRKCPPFIWAENKIPQRLHVGGQFTWKGARVVVTSIDAKEKCLVACAYKTDWQEHKEPAKIGDKFHFDDGGNWQDVRTLQYIKRLDDGSLIAHLSALAPNDDDRDSRKVLKRFKITVDDLNAVRKDYDKRCAEVLKTIRACATIADLDALAKGPHKSRDFRHFDVEAIQKTFNQQREQIERSLTEQQREQLEKQRHAAEFAERDRWAAGEDVGGKVWLEAVADVRIRIKGEFVETSNGHRVSVDSAKRMLKLIFAKRLIGESAIAEMARSLQGETIDGFQFAAANAFGIKFGCTIIPWPEVERCKKLLKVKR